MPPRDRRPGEFGGVPGRIQPPPHEPTTDETLSLIYELDPAVTYEVVPETKKAK
jgi:hypothetical protein